MPKRDAKWRDPLRGERIEFPSRRGNLLVGELHRPGDLCGRALVLCHGMESTRSGAKQKAFVARFVPRGFTVLRFDFSFVGESEGSFEDLTISGEVDDALGALDFLGEFAPTSTVMVGSSLGGAVAMLAAAHAPETVAGVVTIAAVADTAIFTAGLDESRIAAWRREGRRRWGDGYLKSSFLDDLERLDIAAAVGSLTVPQLVAHGVADEVVPFSHAELIVRIAAERAELHPFAGVGHRFEEPGALDTLLDAVEGWLVRIDAEGGRA